MRGARLGEALFGCFLLGVGVVAIYVAGALPFGSVQEPGAGLFPVSIAVLLIVLAALALAVGKGAAQGAAERAGIVRVVVLIGALAAYVWLLPRLGFIACTVALLVLMLRGLGRVGWLWTAVFALAGTLGCYVLFTRLGMPLPAGLLAF